MVFLLGIVQTSRYPNPGRYKGHKKNLDDRRRTEETHRWVSNANIFPEWRKPILK